MVPKNFRSTDRKKRRPMEFVHKVKVELDRINERIASEAKYDGCPLDGSQMV